MVLRFEIRRPWTSIVRNGTQQNTLDGQGSKIGSNSSIPRLCFGILGKKEEHVGWQCSHPNKAIFFTKNNLERCTRGKIEMTSGGQSKDGEGTNWKPFDRRCIAQSLVFRVNSCEWPSKVDINNYFVYGVLWRVKVFGGWFFFNIWRLNMKKFFSPLLNGTHPKVPW